MLSPSSEIINAFLMKEIFLSFGVTINVVLVLDLLE